MAVSKINQYEAMFLFGSSFATELEKAQGLVRKIVESHQGEILVLKKWDERKLAYEVGGNKRGVYVLTLFKAPPGVIAAIERDVKLSEDILRVLVLTAEHINADEVSAMEPQKPEPREERPDRGFGGFGGGFGGGGGGGYGDRSDRPFRGPRRDDAELPAGSDKPE